MRIATCTPSSIRSTKRSERRNSTCTSGQRAKKRPSRGTICSRPKATEAATRRGIVNLLTPLRPSAPDTTNMAAMVIGAEFEKTLMTSVFGTSPNTMNSAAPPRAVTSGGCHSTMNAANFFRPPTMRPTQNTASAALVPRGARR